MEKFCQELLKVELHAHLNGSLSPETIEKLKNLRSTNENLHNQESYIKDGAKRENLEDTLQVFKTVQSLTTTPEAIKLATQETICEFANDNVLYLELRSGPRCNNEMTKRDYLNAILEGIRETRAKLKSYPELEITVKFIPSIDRKVGISGAEEIFNLALEFSGFPDSPIVGIDLSGDPNVDGRQFIPILQKARSRGLKTGIHLAETPNCQEEIPEMIEISDRIGHGTYFDMNPDNVRLVEERQIPMELCLTSNVKSGTVKDYGSHHMGMWIEKNHPLAICTDDKGVFATNLSKELGLTAYTFNVSLEKIKYFAQNSIKFAFCDEKLKNEIRNILKF